MEIMIDIDLCYGCKTCQLVCSFHHTGTFWPDRSSISVFRNPQNGIVKWSIDSTCDGCKGENEPLCVKYCVYKAIRIVKKDIKKKEGRVHDYDRQY